MHIDEGGWVEYRGYKLWIHGIKDMTKAEILKDCNEIMRSGWMNKNTWVADAIKK
jgi:hypothetical protein